MDIVALVYRTYDNTGITDYRALAKQIVSNVPAADRAEALEEALTLVIPNAMLRRRGPIVGPTGPAVSTKRNAERAWWQAHLTDAYESPSGKKPLRDFDEEACMWQARKLRASAAAFTRRAIEWEELAEKLRKVGVATVGQL
jgi:hypothetical protein